MTTGPTNQSDADSSRSGETAPEDMAKRSRAARLLFNKRVVKAVGILIVVGLL
jgi:hypothetical protein